MKITRIPAAVTAVGALVLGSPAAALADTDEAVENPPVVDAAVLETDAPEADVTVADGETLDSETNETNPSESQSYEDGSSASDFFVSEREVTPRELTTVEAGPNVVSESEPEVTNEATEVQVTEMIDEVGAAEEIIGFDFWVPERSLANRNNILVYRVPGVEFTWGETATTSFNGFEDVLVISEGGYVTVTATAQEGHTFPEGTPTEWSFEYISVNDEDDEDDYDDYEPGDSVLPDLERETDDWGNILITAFDGPILANGVITIPDDPGLSFFETRDSEANASDPRVRVRTFDPGEQVELPLGENIVIGYEVRPGYRMQIRPDSVDYAWDLTHHGEVEEPVRVGNSIQLPVVPGLNYRALIQDAGSVQLRVAGSNGDTVEIPEGGRLLVTIDPTAWVWDSGHGGSLRDWFFDYDAASDGGNTEATSVTPEIPVQTGNTVVIPSTPGVDYGYAAGATIEIPEDGLTVQAAPQDGYAFSTGTASTWSFQFTAPENEAETDDEDETNSEGGGADSGGSAEAPEADNSNDTPGDRDPDAGDSGASAGDVDTAVGTEDSATDTDGSESVAGTEGVNDSSSDSAAGMRDSTAPAADNDSDVTSQRSSLEHVGSHGGTGHGLTDGSGAVSDESATHPKGLAKTGLSAGWTALGSVLLVLFGLAVLWPVRMRRASQR